MADYIDRDKVLEAILGLPPKMDEQGYGWLGRRGVWQMICDFQSSDVAPVVHGKWICHDDELLGLTTECSVCHVEGCLNGHYCPNCGAKMDLLN